MPTNRLPNPGQDAGNWGTILNSYLRVSHDSKGSINTWTDGSGRPTNPDDGVTGVNLQKGLFEQWNSTTNQWTEVTKLGSSPTVTGGTGIISVNTIADLKALNTTQIGAGGSSTTSNNTVQVLGYYTANDGGGGVFQFLSSSNSTDDGGSIISPNTGNGRWVRENHTGQVHVRWFGAKGDGVADDTGSIQRALNFVAASTNCKTVFVDSTSQYYKVTSTLLISANCNLTGSGITSAIIQSAEVTSTGQPNCINVTGSNVSITDINISGLNNEIYNEASYGYTNSGGIATPVNGLENLTIERCIIHNFFRFGINVSCRSGGRYRFNFVYGNNGYGGDILTTGGYGGANEVKRTVVHGNYCLSNSYNTGIGVDQSTTKDVTITNNFIIVLDSNGEILVDPTKPLRRHGILVQYAAGAASNNTVEQRMIISDNFIRNTSWTAIYCNDTPVVNNVYYIQGCGPYLITGNFISDIGINGRLSDHDTGLSAGICMVGVGDGDVISNNILIRCGSSADVKTQIGALKLTQSGGGDKKVTFSDNTIKDCYTGFTSFILPHNVELRNNLFINSASNDIGINYGANKNTSPKSSIVGNRFYRGNTNSPSIYINTASATDPILITNNIFHGAGNTGNNNIAIQFGSNNVIVKNNFISNYFKGITVTNYSAPINSYLPQIDQNIFEKIGSNAIEVAGSGLLLLEGNVFNSDVITPISGSVRIGRRNFKNVEIFVNSVPTSGTWSAGDRAINSTPVSGQPTGWACTASGTPGTWKSLGNLA